MEGQMAKSANLTVQQWGNSLAVRIPAGIARSARLSIGQPVEVVLEEVGITVRPVGLPKLSLAQKLALFDPAVHGREAMAVTPVGGEAM
jgi:antitoxin MazE